MATKHVLLEFVVVGPPEGQRVTIIKQLAALAVLALTLSGCAPLPIGAAAGGATALVATDPHWCRQHRYYRYDLEWHQNMAMQARE
jgi:hypothetical protein